MRNDVKALLEPIVEALNKNDRTAKQLWDILSALRGPDIEPRHFATQYDYLSLTTVKELTTERIRFAIGLRGSRYSGAELGGVHGALLSENPLPSPSDAQKEGAKLSDHFSYHVLNAIQAIQEEDQNVSSA
jgi:hypothetical protein